MFMTNKEETHLLPLNMNTMKRVMCDKNNTKLVILFKHNYAKL